MLLSSSSSSSRCNSSGGNSSGSNGAAAAVAQGCMSDLRCCTAGLTVWWRWVGVGGDWAPLAGSYQAQAWLLPAIAHTCTAIDVTPHSGADCCTHTGTACCTHTDIVFCVAWRCLQVPIMLKSLLCSIKDMSDRELMEVGECPYDQVGQHCRTACCRLTPERCIQPGLPAKAALVKRCKTQCKRISQRRCTETLH